MKHKKTIFVGMSGGVDSSVSAAILKKATPKNFKKLFGRPTPKGFRGYNVVGVFIRTWHPDFIKCSEEDERRDAMRVCAHLDIPFLTFDFEKIYKKEVADYMIREYKAGRTPNPDVMCNREIKFGAFLRKALSMGADYVATGHYVQVFSPDKNRRNFPAFALGAKKTGNPRLSKFLGFCLGKGKDPSKDQSYFLWTLTQKELYKIIFPVGGMNKSEVRKLARKFKLPVAEKKDSQGICFLGMVDLKDFLKHYIKEKKGEVILVPNGVEGEKKEVIGYHFGVYFYTLGERHGFTITKKTENDKPYYVVCKDINKNVLYVSEDKNSKNSGAFALGAKKTGDPRRLEFLNSCLFLKDTNWISGIPKSDKNYTAQVRYHGEYLPCKVKIKNKNTAQVIFEKQVLVDSSQSCVIYDGDICLGGGIII